MKINFEKQFGEWTFAGRIDETELVKAYEVVRKIEQHIVNSEGVHVRLDLSKEDLCEDVKFMDIRTALQGVDISNFTMEEIADKIDGSTPKEPEPTKVVKLKGKN